MSSVDILLPTGNRLQSLIMCLSGIAGQSYSHFRLILSDQSDPPLKGDAVIQSLLRVIEARGATVDWHYHVPSQGIAEQRDFLLKQATARYVLYLDDDVWMEPHVLENLVNTIEEQQCGFVGAFPSDLSYRDDYRPQQQHIEFWEGPIEAEAVNPHTPAWERSTLHHAANLYHVALGIPKGQQYPYKVAWTAACILYDREKLLEVGGFKFWHRLPPEHSGEEALVQNLMMRRWGGCSLIPSGTYFSEVPSTTSNENGIVDEHILSLLDEMVEKYAPDRQPERVA